MDVEMALRRRRWTRRGIAAGLALLALWIVLDHLGCFGYAGNDHTRFDGRSFRILRAEGGDALFVRPGSAGAETRVRLLGVAVPRMQGGDGQAEYWAGESAAALAALANGKTVTLRLEPLRTRDASGALLAYVFVSDSTTLNEQMARGGNAYADRRTEDEMSPTIETAETDARKHHRGMWQNIHDDQQPRWRQQWLAELHLHRIEAATQGE